MRDMVLEIIFNKESSVWLKETWSKTWKNEIASLPPPSLFLSCSLGKFEEGEGRGDCSTRRGRKPPKWLVSRAELKWEELSENSAKCETCWHYKPLFLSHLSHRVINISRLWSRLFSFLQAIVEGPFFLLKYFLGTCGHSVIHLLCCRHGDDG